MVANLMVHDSTNTNCIWKSCFCLYHLSITLMRNATFTAEHRTSIWSQFSVLCRVQVVWCRCCCRRAFFCQIIGMQEIIVVKHQTNIPCAAVQKNSNANRLADGGVLFTSKEAATLLKIVMTHHKRIIIQANNSLNVWCGDAGSVQGYFWRRHGKKRHTI